MPSCVCVPPVCLCCSKATPTNYFNCSRVGLGCCCCSLLPLPGGASRYNCPREQQQGLQRAWGAAAGFKSTHTLRDIYGRATWALPSLSNEKSNNARIPHAPQSLLLPYPLARSAVCGRLYAERLRAQSQSQTEPACLPAFLSLGGHQKAFLQLSLPLPPAAFRFVYAVLRSVSGYAFVFLGLRLPSSKGSFPCNSCTPLPSSRQCKYTWNAIKMCLLSYLPWRKALARAHMCVL